MQALVTITRPLGAPHQLVRVRCTNDSAGRSNGWHWTRGQSIVELAIAAPVLVFLLLAAPDFGRLFYVWTAVNNAARAGAQFGSQTVTNAANSTGMVLAATTDGSNITGLSATASQCTCASGTSVPACSGSN